MCYLFVIFQSNIRKSPILNLLFYDVKTNIVINCFENCIFYLYSNTLSAFFCAVFPQKIILLSSDCSENKTAVSFHPFLCLPPKNRTKIKINEAVKLSLIHLIYRLYCHRTAKNYSVLFHPSALYSFLFPHQQNYPLLPASLSHPVIY